MRSITVPERVAKRVVYTTNPSDWTWWWTGWGCTDGIGNCVEYALKKWPEFSQWCE